jgi:3-oxoacyl-[acyl-carrier protein] reductase
MAFDLSGKIALVTGGGRGIGAAAVKRLAEAGAAVVIVNRTRDVAEALSTELTAKGHRTSVLPYPGSGRGELASLVADAADRHGGIDILIHNAGGCPWASLGDLTEEGLEETLAINLKACFWLAQAAIPRMKARGGGRIIVTSSISARLAMGGGAHYSAAKAGVNAFIRGAAFEYARDNITVNGVEPGFIAKPGRGKLSDPAIDTALVREIPMGHRGEADDVAYAMLYLASAEAKYITGQTIVIDGGASLPETGFAVDRQWPAP